MEKLSTFEDVLASRKSTKVDLTPRGNARPIALADVLPFELSGEHLAAGYPTANAGVRGKNVKIYLQGCQPTSRLSR